MSAGLYEPMDRMGNEESDGQIQSWGSIKSQIFVCIRISFSAVDYVK